MASVVTMSAAGHWMTHSSDILTNILINNAMSIRMTRMECKRKIDGRKLDRKAKEALRFRVIGQVRDGVSPETVAKVLDINQKQEIPRLCRGTRKV
jgi:hypothetical protein